MADSTASRRREVEAGLLRKADYEKEALRWVEYLLEPGISADQLVQAAQHLTRNHYEDVVEERNIGKLCGYPACSHQLGPVPRQKYHISVERRQVFDLTERKKYCSSDCYKASKYYSSQLSTVPVWARDGRHIVVNLLSPAGRVKEVTTPPESEQRTSLKDTDSAVREQSPPKDLPPSADADGQTTTDNPSEGNTDVDSLGQSLDSLQLVESSVSVDRQTTVDTPTMAVESSSYPPSTMTVEHTPVSSVAKLQHAMSVWCTAATSEFLREGGGGGGGRGRGGGGGVEEGEPLGSPFLPPVHSVERTQLQRSIFMQQLKRNLPEVAGHVGGVSPHQMLPTLTELIKTFRLDRHSITFRPAEWKVILVVLIHSVHPWLNVVQSDQVDNWLSGIQASHKDLTVMLSIFSPQD